MQEVPWLPIVAFLVAWLTTDRLIPLVCRFAERWRCYDQPGDRKVHSAPVPRLGGVAIAAGLAVAIATAEVLRPGVIAPFSAPQAGLFAGAIVVFLLGLLDDLRPLPAMFKLGVQILAAALAVSGGLCLPASGAWALWPAVSTALAMGWLVGVTNTINLVDGLDGLAGTLGLIAAVALALLTWQAHGAAGALVTMAVIGALAGFLRYNWHPAQIFMGDSGSLLLGFTLAALSLMWLRETPHPASALVPLLILAVPLLDTALAIARRVWGRRPIFSPDRAHLHHRLLARSGCQRRTVLTLGGVASLGAGAAAWLEGQTAGAPLVWSSLALLLAVRGSRARRSPHHVPEPGPPLHAASDILEVH